MALQQNFVRGRWRSLALFSVIALGALGCRPHDSAILARADHSAPSVPLNSSRAQLEEAKKLDSSVRLGFFALPISHPVSGELATDLATAMRTEVAPQSWNLPGRTMTRQSRWLVVTQPPAILDEIAAWMETRRRVEESTHPMVQSEFRVISLPTGGDQLVRSAGIEAVSTVAPDATTIFHPTEAQLGALLEMDDVSSLLAPRVATFSGQPASLSIINERAYLSSYEVYQVEKSSFADPRIDVVQEGLAIELTATSFDEQKIEMALQVNLADLLAMERQVVNLDSELQGLEIEMPETRSVTRTITLKSASGEWLLFPVSNARGPAVDRSEVTEEDFSDFSTKVPWIAVRSEIVPR